MSRQDLENKNLEKLAPPDRLLFLLKTRGPQTAADLGTRLQITPEAVRQQLLRLVDEALVYAKSEVRGVGRPAQVYHLAPAAQRRFPDAHAELTAQLIGEIRDVLGESALDKLIRVREIATRKRYEALLSGERSLGQKVAHLAEIRNKEGYMANWEKEEEGDSYLLVENHCPICAAASACTGFCRSEQAIFEHVLGRDVRVERVEHLLAGARRCAYRISKKTTNKREKDGVQTANRHE
ncbi:MAG TPA: metalloregulator ArsR/SmtB family transcription factor [Chthoniobacterales bacterium]|nr:metalloregulator ArsR/SmtB family transcription factor [Chthoniobacterales bacterium]